jgi:hypothetical protein
VTAVETRTAVPTAGRLRSRVRALKPPRLPSLTVSVLAERALYLGIFGGLAAEALRAGFGRISADGSVPETPSTSVIHLTAAILTLLGLAFVGKALLAFGPLYVRGPARTWLLSTPVDRGRLLLGHLAAAATIGMLVSVALGTAFLLIIGISAPIAPWLALWAALGVTVTCLCVVVQARRATRAVQRGLNVVVVALVGVAVAGLVLRPGLVLSGLEHVGVGMFAAAAGGFVATAAVAALAARRSLDALTRGTVSSGAELATATQVSILSLDVTLFWAIVLERRARAVARVRPAPISGNRFTALIRTDLARVVRMPTGLLVWAALLPVPYGAHLMGLTAYLPALQVIVAFVAVDRLASGLRVIARSPAVRRALGGSDLLLTLAHLVVPTTGAVIWTAVTALTVPAISPLTATISAAGAVLVTYRIATRPPLDYQSGMVDFGILGPTPIGLIMQLLRGPALLGGVSILQLALAG